MLGVFKRNWVFAFLCKCCSGGPVEGDTSRGLPISGYGRMIINLEGRCMNDGDGR